MLAELGIPNIVFLLEIDFNDSFAGVEVAGSSHDQDLVWRLRKD
jgi:hypothetical protein